MSGKLLDSIEVPNRFRLLLATPGGEPVACKLEEITPESVQVSLSSSTAPAIGMSRPAELWISDSPSGTSVVVPAVACNRNEANDKCVYTLQFVDPGAVDALLHRDLVRLFDRRQAFRAVPREGNIIDVTVEPPEDANLEPLRTTIVDVSTTGLAFDVPVEFEAEMIVFDHLTVHFLLPGSTWPNVFVCLIRNRSWKNPNFVRYGIEFEEARTIQFKTQKDHVIEYVLKRRVETSNAGEEQGSFDIRTLPPPVKKAS
ncbi:MAG: hypothetical protein GWP91_07000 [Rhodobacterales bacterium]|nr:hypothetical protein [Rhodobacterales bacterium]